jgi:mono/diheme cytochrome c family protein
VLGFRACLDFREEDLAVKGENVMSVDKLILVISVLIALPGTVAAQNQTQDQTKTTIQHVTIKPTSPASGKEMYTSYCAVCHGADGKGGGPAASALKTPPADLSALSKTNGGKFPSMKVSSILRGTSDLPAHGSKEMPVWGPLFRSVSTGHEGEVQQRIANLTAYLESLQAK